jgi:hypothetical protein
MVTKRRRTTPKSIKLRRFTGRIVQKRNGQVQIVGRAAAASPKRNVAQGFMDVGGGL